MDNSDNSGEDFNKFMDDMMFEAAMKNHQVRKAFMQTTLLSCFTGQVLGLKADRIFVDEHGVDNNLQDMAEIIDSWVEEFCNNLEDHSTPLFTSLSMGIPTEHWADWTTELQGIMKSEAMQTAIMSIAAFHISRIEKGEIQNEPHFHAMSVKFMSESRTWGESVGIL